VDIQIDIADANGTVFLWRKPLFNTRCRKHRELPTWRRMVNTKCPITTA